MIFSLFSRVAVKVGDDERHIFDRARLMYSEVAEIEKVSGLSYGEWEMELGRYSMRAVGPLLHVLRKRGGGHSDYATMEFNAADFDVVPLNEDDSEMTPQEVAAELARRVKAAEPDPTPAVAAEPSARPIPATATATNGTSHSSPSTTVSGRGNGKSSPGVTSASSKLTPTGS